MVWCCQYSCCLGELDGGGALGATHFLCPLTRAHTLITQERVQHLSKMLRITHDSAVAVCTKLPRLLTLPPKEQQHRLNAAAKLLGVSQAAIRDVAVLQPGLLAHPTPVLK